MTEEQQKDIAKRQEEFKKEYIELTKRLEIDFASYPVFVPSENGTFMVTLQTTLADRKYASVPSPFTDKKIIE